VWAICRACSGSERAVSVNGVFFRVVCVQCAINVYRKAVRTVRERGAAGEGVGARARTTDRLPSPLYNIYKVNYIIASLAIIYVHCFILCYALLCMHLYHLIYVKYYSTYPLYGFMHFTCVAYTNHSSCIHICPTTYATKCTLMHAHVAACLMHAYASASACTVMSGLCMSMRGCALCN
jgi:hypothetical protein